MLADLKSFKTPGPAITAAAVTLIRYVMLYTSERMRSAKYMPSEIVPR